MHELDDNALLLQYAEHNSEAAFATLVARQVDKVYSVALRHTRNVHAAEEITQAVFVILAKKSGRLGAKVILAGWLYETARLTALTYIRSEIRRARREQEAHMQTVLNENADDAWPHIAPLLDDALAGLSATDRHAVVLRYFDGKSLGEVGAAMGASEEAAKKRVTRAVEKLRSFFTRHGVMLTATVLTAAIAANSVQAAPLGLAATVTATAAKGAVVGGSTLTLIKGALKVMAWTKMKIAVAVGAGVLLAAGTAITVEKIIAPSAPFIRITGKCQIELYTKPPRVVETGQLVILTDGKSYLISIDSKGEGRLTNDVYDVKAEYGSDGIDSFVLSDQISILHRTHEGFGGFAFPGRLSGNAFAAPVIKAVWLGYCSRDYFNISNNQTGLQLGEDFSMIWPDFVTNQVTYWPTSTLPQSITGWSRNWIIAQRTNSLQPLQAIELSQYPNGFKAWKFTAGNPVMIGKIRVPRRLTLETFFPEPPATATTGDATMPLRKATFTADSIEIGKGKFDPLPKVPVPDLPVLDSRFKDIAASFVITSHATSKGWPIRGSVGFNHAFSEAKKLASENRDFVQSELKQIAQVVIPP